MAEPHATPASTSDPHAAPHAEHITSWAPIIIASSIGFIYLGFLFPAYTLPIGIPIMAVGLGWWIREDILRFRKVAAHPVAEHGHPGPWLGMALFICTEVMIFGSLFAVWFYGKANAPDWAFATLPIVPTGINTAILVASGGTLHWGYLGLKKNNYNRYLTGLVLTIILGAIFLAQQVREYISLVQHEDFTITTKLYGSIFYMLTGTHGAHVAGGLVFLSIVLFRSLKRTQSKDHHIALETAAMYWHFVDVVWLFLFVVVYLQWL